MEYKLRKTLRQCITCLIRCCLVLLVAVLILGSLYAGLDPNDGLIMENVSVGGIDLGGMTAEQAYRKLKASSESVLEQTVLSAEFPEESVCLSPADTGASLRCLSALWDAWTVGRFSNQNPDIPLADHLKLDEGYIRQVISAYAAQYDTDLTPSRYALTGQMPDLEIETGDTITQTLELTMGLPTARLDQEDAFLRILDTYNSAFTGECTAADFQVDILEEPELPDLKAVYEAVYIPPVDDSIDLENHCVIPGAWGYHFNAEDAQELVDSAKFGETVYIPMEFQEPEIHGDKVYFRDVLGSCETKHTDDEDRNHNLTLACKSMNGVVLQPGETFSYNDTLGQRTKENGYRRAGAYSGWELVRAYGGGICQGSSTLYCAALYADLEIVQRKNHGYKVGYLDAGLDATVNWGGPDFQFRNNTNFPIKIAAEVSDGCVKIRILGTEERDYYIKMETEVQWGKSTIHAKSFKCRYDRTTDALISRDLEAKSNYMR